MAESVYEYQYVFPAVRGIQAKSEYFTCMVPLELIPKIFLFDGDDVPPELRAQRQLNRNRIPEMTRYIVENRNTYVFSALTASIEGETTFIPAGDEASQVNNGTLHIKMNSRFLINDGQHRRAAIEQALREGDPDLSDETIAVVFFINKDLSTNQQMFADLNRYAIRPSKSMGILYDQRDEDAEITRKVVETVSFFREFVEKEKTSISPKSRRLFTLNNLSNANKDLLSQVNGDEAEKVKIANSFWEKVGNVIPEWKSVIDYKLTAGEVREDYIHTQGVTLRAIAKAGSELIKMDPNGWENKLEALGEINWRRSEKVWNGRAIENGKLRNTLQNINLTAIVIKQRLQIPLNKDEKQIETAFVSRSQ